MCVFVNEDLKLPYKGFIYFLPTAGRLHMYHEHCENTQILLSLTGLQFLVLRHDRVTSKMPLPASIHTKTSASRHGHEQCLIALDKIPLTHRIRLCMLWSECIYIPQNSDVEILTANVILGGGAFGR